MIFSPYETNLKPSSQSRGQVPDDYNKQHENADKKNEAIYTGKAY